MRNAIHWFQGECPVIRPSVPKHTKDQAVRINVGHDINRAMFYEMVVECSKKYGDIHLTWRDYVEMLHGELFGVLIEQQKPNAECDYAQLFAQMVSQYYNRQHEITAFPALRATPDHAVAGSGDSSSGPADVQPSEPPEVQMRRASDIGGPPVNRTIPRFRETHPDGFEGGRSDSGDEMCPVRRFSRKRSPDP